MKKISINKISLLFVLLWNSTIVSAISFDTLKLKDSSSSNYLGFTSKNGLINDKYEKIIADFNGDGFDDILSIGGPIPCSICSPTPPPAPVEVLLYDNGEYVYHEIDTYYSNGFVKVIDMDKDGDKDIVFKNGKIALNDGDANFSSLPTGITLSDNFYVLDWNGDDVIDIVTNAHIFINDGNLNFTQTSNTVANGNSILVANLDTNSTNDMLVIEGKQLQSWAQDAAGEFSMSSSLVIDQEIDQVKAIDVDSDGVADFIVVSSNESGPIIQLIINDGTGELNISDFEFSQINDVSYDNMQITKIFVQDSDDDGDNDLWLNATFSSSELQCENKQNLLLVYENLEDGNLQYKRSLHSIGYKKSSIFYELETENFPTLIDLNHDNKLDVVMPGESPVAWIQSNNLGDFELSNISSIQFNNYVQVVDFNADGNMDILSSGRYAGSCKAVPRTDDITSITSSSAGKLWLGDGIGEFEPYFTGIAGLVNFNSSSEYSKLIDVFQDGNYLFINTIPEFDGFQRQTTISYPRLADPGIHGPLPEPTLLIEAADLTNNGKLELVMLADTQEAAIYVLGVPNNSPLPSEVIAKLDFGFRGGEIQLEDMDGDGNIDIVASNNMGKEGSVTIWYNDGNKGFIQSPYFTNYAFGFATLDMNSDGLLDILISNRDIWINQGDRDFEKIRYDSSFWTTPLGLPILSYLVPKKIEVTDFNNDGKDDVIFTNYGNYYVFINDSNSERVLFYLVYSTQFGSTYKQYNAALVDINNDDKLDFVVGTEKNISVHTQVQEQPVIGLYYDLNYSGHGFSVNAIGKKNLYYSIFYSYDDEGKPQWYASLNRYTKFDWNGNDSYYFTAVDNSKAIHYFYDYNTQTAQIDMSSENMGYLFYSGSNQDNTLDKFSYIMGEEFDNWNIQPIIQNSQIPENNFSGLWWAGADDPGWGVSLSFVQRDGFQEVVAILYFYDEFGNPRWLIGQSAGFETNQDIVVDMKQINGYGRMQNYVELTEISAGTITLNLQQASKELGQAGSMSMDVFYPDDQPNDNWVRNNIPISLFSKPRDQ